MSFWRLPRYSTTTALSTTTATGIIVTTSRGCRAFTTSVRLGKADPRVRELGREITDDYAAIREKYQRPKHPIVLAHGLLGFASLPSPLPALLPTIHYWHGITPALTAQNIRVITPAVPPSGSIEERAAKLSSDISTQLAISQEARDIDEKALDENSDGGGEEEVGVNIIAHSMGGLDARYMIAHCPPPGVKIKSLTTIATPHRGSSFADYVLSPDSGPLYLPRTYPLLNLLSLSTTAFSQLTTPYLTQNFNPSTPDSPSVRYLSFGAAATTPPPPLSPFRKPWSVIREREGENDGLVSVESSRWGEYRGTLMEVSHLDLINWSNRLRWTVREWMGMEKKFNAVALYLDIADMLAKEGL